MRNLLLNLKRKETISCVVLNICVIASYFFLALVSKKALDWESQAIIFWPASGLANALAVSYGWRVLPGIVIGNLLGTACDPNTGFSFQQFMFPVAIAAGAQAALIRWLLIRKNILNNTLNGLQDLFRFLLWVGPLGNWPAATTFFVYNLIHSDTSFLLAQSLTNSFFWWIGDSLGSLMLFPLLIMLIPLNRPIWHERKAYLLKPLLILAAVLVSMALIEIVVLEREVTPILVTPPQDLKLIFDSAWTLIALGGVVGLILQMTGNALQQERDSIHSRLAADAAGAVIHEIGQPLIRLQLRLEKIVTSLQQNVDEPFLNSSTYSELKSETEQSLNELDSVVLNTRSIQDLTLAGIRDTTSADLKDAIATSSIRLRQEFDRLDQDLSLHISNKLPKVNAGQVQLQSAIRNLLSNASKAAGVNGVIRVYVRHLREYVCFEIEDSGSGFDPLYVPDGKKKYKSDTNGMGIGLMIVRRVIDDNGGRIEFTESEALGGAKVKIWLKTSCN